MKDFIEAAAISAAIVMAIMFGTWIHDALRSVA